MFLITNQEGEVIVESSEKFVDFKPTILPPLENCIVFDEKEKIDSFNRYESVEVTNILNGQIVTVKKKNKEQPKTEFELLNERVLQLEVAEVNRKSSEIESKIMGGTI